MRVLIIICVTAFLLLSCEGDPLLTSLTTSNMKIIYKGTYASNDPRPWWDGAAVSPGDLVDDSATNTVPEELPEFILPDIAEIRINGEKFAVDRTYRNASLDDEDPLFSGEGVSISCNDLEHSKTYSKLEIYFRKLIYGNANAFTSNWNFDEKIKTQFGNDELEGFDVIQNIKFTQEAVDNDKEKNLVFPYKINLFSEYTHSRDNERVIEFRIVFKNNIKYYEYADEDDDVFVGYFGPGDSVEDVSPGDQYIGGNLRGSVYVYDPAQVVSLTGSAPPNTYVVAIEEDDTIDSYIGTGNIPPRATWCADGAYTLENVMAGKTYLLYYSSHTPSAVGAEAVNGFAGEQAVEVEASQAGETIQVNL